MENQYKYFAFISYNSKDIKWGRRLQKKLENYRMPITMCNEHGWKRKPIKPVFFAPTDIQPGGLSEELQERLKASRNLIVICSPNSAQSEWVGKEIELFHNLGRVKHLHFFIVDGIPHSNNSSTECFNPVIDCLGLPEILGANINEQSQTYPFTNIPWAFMNKERAYVQLISKLLEVEFDSIWQRHKRQLVQKIISVIIGFLMVFVALFCVWYTNQPVDVKIQLKEANTYNSQLPPLKDAVVTLTLENETKTDTTNRIEQTVTFTNIPQRYLGKEVRLLISCKDFLPVDTMITLTKEQSILIQRDRAVYGDIKFSLWNPNDESYLNNVEIMIEGISVFSDNNGFVSIHIPLGHQKTAYRIISSVPLESDSLFMPCGECDVILAK